MGIVIRQTFKGSIVSYLGVIIGTISYMWFFPKFLTAGEIGVIQFVQTVAVTLAIFLQFGAPATLIKFIPTFSKEQQPAFFNFILLYSLPAVTILSAVYLVLKPVIIDFYIEESPEVLPYFTEVLILIIFNVILNLLESYSRINMRIVVPNLLRDVLLRILNLLLILAYVFAWLQFDQVISLLVLNYFLLIILNTFYLKNLGVLNSTVVFPKATLKPMITYSSFVLLGSASTVIISRIDVLMIGSMLGMREVGIFTITFFMGSIIEIPRKSISQIVSPLISASWQKSDMESMKSIYQKSSLNLFLIGSVLFMGIWLNTDLIFHLIPKSEIYREGLYVILFVGLTKLIDMSFGPNSEMIGYSRYFRFNLVLVVILSALLIITNLWLIPRYGIVGAAMATFLSNLLFNLAKFLFLYVKFRLFPFNQKYILAIFVVVTIFVIAYNIQLEDPLFQSFLRSFAILMQAFLAIYFLKISPELVATTNSLLERIFRVKAD